jgi:pyrophosphatase PpaX
VVTSIPDRGRAAGFDPVVFDLDGTVVDTVELMRDSFRYTVKKVLGSELPESVMLAGVGQPLMLQMQALSPEHADELYDVYREYNHRRHDELIRSYEGMQAVLESLKTAGRRLGIVTSKSADTTQMAFKAIGIGHLFEAIVTAGDTTEHKPSPVPVQLCVQRLGGGHGIYIGDSPVDIRAGAAAGLATAAVLWGIFSKEDLLTARPDYVLAAPQQIVSLCVHGQAPAEVEP